MEQFCITVYQVSTTDSTGILLPYSFPVCVCVFVFSSRSFWTPSSLDVPAGVTREEGHSIFHPPSLYILVLYIICCEKNPELASQRVKVITGGYL